ncbi:MAG: dethiobiotin synthase [Gordonia sp. (in: high G+C Gram-positive bacteria)]
MSATLAITGTSTDVGKTVVTAALAAALLARDVDVAVCKPVQTGVSAGEVGDLAVVTALAGPVPMLECVRYPDPLAPETAARHAGRPLVDPGALHRSIERFADAHDRTLIEGAGGVLVRLGADHTLLDVATALNADLLVVVPAGLGALNHAELTVQAIRAAGLRPAGLVIGAWPAEPGLAERCNRADLPRLTGVPLVGVVPAGVGTLSRAAFAAAAPTWFDPDWLAALAGPDAVAVGPPGLPSTRSQPSPQGEPV